MLNSPNYEDYVHNADNDNLFLQQEFEDNEIFNIRRNRFLENQEFHPIRIHFDYTTLNMQKGKYNETLISSIKEILTDAQTVFQNLISVRSYGVKLNFTSCKSKNMNISIGEEVKNGVDTDLVIFPFFDHDLLSTKTEAYATACILCSVDKRPCAGFIGFSPKINNEKPNWKSYYSMLTLHELSHVLVFHPMLFNFFTNPNREPYDMSQVFLNATVNGLPRKLVAFPRTLQAAKDHFNCPSLKGLELENQGGAGTNSGHWEARIMLGDYMIGITFDDTAISEITLSLFEDSGWYKVNFFTGGLFKYGKNKGCDFLKKKCIENGVSISEEEFCMVPNMSTCLSNRMSRGFCYINDNSNPTDPEYVYFPRNTTGGFILADFCPINVAPTDNSYFYPWNCVYGKSNYPTEFEEKIGLNSACFISNIYNNSTSTKKYRPIFRATCYEYSCNFDKAILQVQVGDEKLNCPKEGGPVYPSSDYTGSIICPDFYKICTSETRCHDLIDCAVKNALPAKHIFNYKPITISTPTTGYGPYPATAANENYLFLFCLIIGLAIVIFVLWRILKKFEKESYENLKARFIEIQ